MLKFRYTKLEDIPKGYEGAYEEKDENGTKVWLLKCDGVVESSKLDEFRTNNRKLHTELTELKTKFDGVDLDEFTKLKEIVGGLKPDEVTEILKNGKNVDKIVTDRTAAMRADHEKSLTAVRTDRDRVQQRLEHVEINQAAIAEAIKLGLRPSAAADISWRARSVFKLDKDGKSVAYEEDGKTPKYGKDGTPMTIAEWAESLKTAAPHLFEESKGSGAGGGDGGKGSGGGKGDGEPNPFKAGPHFNRTKQMQILKADPAKGKRLAGEAGFVLPQTVSSTNKGQ